MNDIQVLKVALIILYDAENRVLLQHRTHDAERLPDYWAFFGGEIEKWENTEEALRRETLEELGYKLTAPELIFEQNFRLSNAEGYMHVFVEEYLGDKSAIELNEGQGMGWFDENELRELKIINHDREALRVIMDYIKNRDTK